MNIQEIISSAKRPEKVVPLCLRGDLQAEWERLQMLFNITDTRIGHEAVLEGGTPAESADIALQMEAVREEMTDAIESFVLRALTRKHWREIIAANPPQEDDEGDVDEEQFVTDIIAACCVSPVMTRDEAADLRDNVFTDGQWQSLATAAWDLNKNVVEIPFSLAAQTRVAITASQAVLT